jgi:hypothetical protein
MNKPAHPVAAPPLSYPSYEKDGYGWAMAQAAIIRAGRIDSIDWENVAEEIESVGRSERKSLKSNLTQLLLHMIKWEVQPERRGKSWYLSIMNHRDEALDDLAKNPSLKPQLDEILDEARDVARKRAERETELSKEVIHAVAITRKDAFERHYDRPEAD